MRSRPLFPVILQVSGLLAVIFIAIFFLFQTINRNDLETSLQRDSQSLKSAYDISISNLSQQMVVLASVFTSDPQVQELFFAARNMVRAEGGGRGAEESARLRAALFQQVSDGWISMQNSFGLRQLHFHLPPDSTSFLRVHVPDQFGDKLSDVRPILAATNHTLTAQTGFEIGRFYSGLRGVVPFFYEFSDGHREYVGTLEAGTSLDDMIERLDRDLGAGIAVTLSHHARDAVSWDELDPEERTSNHECRCYIEASTRPDLLTWLDNGLISPQQSGFALNTSLLEWEGKTYLMTQFPMRDFLGEQQPSREPVGTVIMWQDKTELISSWRKNQRYLLLSLLVAFFVATTLVIWLLNLMRKGLQHRVDIATEELEKTHTQLDSLLAASPAVTYSVSLETHKVTYIAPNVMHKLGYKVNEVYANPNWWSDNIHPDDVGKDTIQADWSQWEDDRTVRRYRFYHALGNWLWLEDRCKVVRNQQGVATELVGSFVDVTEQQETEEKLRVTRKRLELIIEDFPGALMIEDERRCVVLVNTAYCRIFRFEKNMRTLVGSDARKLMSESISAFDEPETQQTQMDSLLEMKQPSFNDEVIFADGRTMERDFLPVSEGSEHLGVLWVYRDITLRKQRESELRRLATTDTLTGLANRRYFLDRLTQELLRTRRYDAIVSLLMLDIDHFKSINDRFGHAQGDEVLKIFSQVCQNSLREVDFIGRLGGEEFAIALPGTDIEGALQFAERLRSTIEETVIPLPDGTDLRVTVSIGLTRLSITDLNVDTPLARTDAALYEAKHLGRNRVVVTSKVVV
ncbi:sensor domain-containing diguanylate cyclase [Nitrincola sp. MINF-07-Sa-05]|uniref:sensor domain-containing diguanylate cyclase n=1 Tax=Nitrincola salilacus TaxID=3400273 RepID=UPI0039183FB6